MYEVQVIKKGVPGRIVKRAHKWVLNWFVRNGVSKIIINRLKAGELKYYEHFTKKYKVTFRATR